MAGWSQGLARTRQRITGVLTQLFRDSGAVDDDTLEAIEETLLLSDVPVRLVSNLLQNLEKSARSSGNGRRDVLRRTLVEACGPCEPVDWSTADPPSTILVIGVNGSGKTTTCAKLAHLAQSEGLKPMLGATDTFRAAGAHQLKLWAERMGCEVVAGATGADAAAVAFDVVDAAIARNADVVILDTAGRMHTKKPLLEELRKVCRALAKRKESAPEETWLVLDGSIGQNAMAQARVFHEAVPLTGVVVTKLDGSAKAGFVFAVTQELGVPIRFVGLGEGEDDLVPFVPESFVDALLGLDPVEEGCPS